MRLDKTKAQPRELELSMLQTTNSDSGKLLDSHSSGRGLEPLRKLSKIGKIQILALLSLLTATVMALVKFIGRNNSAVNPITTILAGSSLPNQLFTNLASRAPNGLDIIGRFDLEDCKRWPVQITSNIDGQAVTTDVSSDCRFKIHQQPGQNFFAYTHNGIKNELDLRDYLISNSKESTLDLGVLPVAKSTEDLLNVNIHAEDLVTGQKIENFVVKVRANERFNSAGDDVATNDAITRISLARGYYTATVEAGDHYRPSLIKFDDLLTKSDIKVFLMRKDLAENLIELKAPISGKRSLTVAFRNLKTQSVCVVGLHSECDGVMFFNRIDTFNSISYQFVAYNEKSNIRVEPSFAPFVQSSHRLLTIIEPTTLDISPEVSVEVNTKKETQPLPKVEEQLIITETTQPKPLTPQTVAKQPVTVANQEPTKIPSPNSTATTAQAQASVKTNVSTTTEPKMTPNQTKKTEPSQANTTETVKPQKTEPTQTKATEQTKSKTAEPSETKTLEPSQTRTSTSTEQTKTTEQSKTTEQTKTAEPTQTKATEKTKTAEQNKTTESTKTNATEQTKTAEPTQTKPTEQNKTESTQTIATEQTKTKSTEQSKSTPVEPSQTKSNESSQTRTVEPSKPLPPQKTAQVLNETSVVTPEGSYTSEEESATLTVSGRTKKNDWKSAELKARPDNHVIIVTTTQGEYFIFSPNITCIRPTRLHDQTVTAVKIEGKGGAFWYFLNYNGTMFTIVTNGTAYPASIYQPNGIIVEIMSFRAKRVAQNRDIFATVTLENGGYFNIEDDMWEQIVAIPVTKWTKQLPEVSIISSNAINLEVSLYGSLLDKLVIEVKEANMKTLFSLLASDGTKVTGQVYSSQRGYRKVTLPSYINPGQFDTYRVCVYCLRKSANQTKFEATINGTHFHHSKLRVVDFMRHKSLLIRFFTEMRHKLTHNIFIEESRRTVDSVYINVDDEGVKQISTDVLKTILNLQLAGNLTQKWVVKVNSSRLLARGFKAPLLVRDDNVYRFSRLVAFAFLTKVTEPVEPLLENILARDYDYKEVGFKDLSFTNKIMFRIFQSGKAYPGLFLKSSESNVVHSWPYILAKEDQVVHKYFLNLLEVRVALKMGAAKDLPAGTLHDTRTPLLLANFRNLIQKMNNSEENLHNRHTVNFHDRVIDISDQCLDAFFDLGLKDLFTPTEKHSRILPRNQFYQNRSGKVYIFNFEVLSKAIDKNEIKDTHKNETVHLCLNLEQISTDARILRHIIVDEDAIFEGYCQGEFVNGTLCRGNFTDGIHKIHCEGSLKKKIDCKPRIHNHFKCDGNITKDGCQGKYSQYITINQTEFILAASGNFSVVSDKIEHQTTLENYTTSANRTIRCGKSYNIPSYLCEDADVKLYKNESKVERFILRCKGTLDVRTMNCTNGEFDFEYCREDNPTVEPKACNGTFLSRHCVNGGSRDHCHTTSPDDKMVNCTGGLWTGSECKTRPLHIIVNKNSYYTGVCNGNYAQNEYCEGKLEGKFIICPGDITPDTLCNKEPVVSFICDGKTTKNGCNGTYRQNTYLLENGKQFVLISQSKDTPVDTQLHINHGVTTLSLRANEDSDLKAINVVCNQNFSDVGKTCGDAQYESVTSDGVTNTKLNIVCKGVLNLLSLTCTGERYNMTRCNTKYPNNPAPICNGTFDSLECYQGGDLSKCFGLDRRNEKNHCQGGIWTGTDCKARPLHIIINNVAYVTGECDGNYTENESCQGTMRGKVIACSPNVTADNLCKGPTVDRFTCIGRLTKNGCNGTYTGGATLRNAKLKLETPANSIITLSKIVRSGIVSLNQEGSDSRYKIEDYSLDHVQTTCNAGYSNPQKTCTSAKFNSILQYSVNNTHVELSCSGKLWMNNLTCESGEYHIHHCNTTVTPYNPTVCNGTYTELKCKNGGNLTSCFGEGNSLINIYCNGTFTNGNCQQYVPPTFSIIHLSGEKWLKGYCSQEIKNNSCKGQFVGDTFATCKGEPLTKKSDFDACIPIVNETFGTCVGETNGTGCTGNYSHKITLHGRELVATTEVPTFYNFETFDQVVRILYNDTDGHTKIKCAAGFNPQKLICKDPHYHSFENVLRPKYPGQTIRRHIACDEGELHLATETCLNGKYYYAECAGRSHVKGVRNFTCLGDYQSVNCTKGGKQGKCDNQTTQIFNHSCTESFFDGNMCHSDKPSENTKIVIHNLPNRIVKDSTGYNRQIAEFEVDSFTMVGAYVAEAHLANNVINNLELSDAHRETDGSLSDLKLFDREYPLSFDEGDITKITFKDFKLDELEYNRFATDDRCVLVHIKFKELIIQETMFYKTTCKNSVIKTLKWGVESVENFGVDTLESPIAYGTIILRNIGIYLPYVSNKTIDKWYNSRFATQKANFKVPKVPGIYLPLYKVNLSGPQHKGEIYLEFPELTLSNLNVDIILMSDYLLGSSSLQSKPQIVGNIMKNYTVDARITAEKKTA